MNAHVVVIISFQRTAKMKKREQVEEVKGLYERRHEADTLSLAIYMTYATVLD